MLIHIGDNEFISEKDCVAIFNLVTIDEKTLWRIFKSINSSKLVNRNLFNKCKDQVEKCMNCTVSTVEELLKHYKSAILRSNGRWILSSISTEALIHRSVADVFKDAYFVQYK